MERDQWSQFKLRVNINAPVDKVYNSWATPGGLEKWFLRKALFSDKTGKEKSKDTAIEGWIFYLANLKSVLEGGLDLRNKRMEITNVITA